MRFPFLIAAGGVFMACVIARAERPDRVAPGERYALVAINGQPLPYTPPQGDAPAFRIVADSFDVLPGPAVRHVRWTRTVMLESWPCDVLRAMRADQAAGRSGGATPAVPSPPASRSGACDELRDDADSSSGRVVEHVGAQRITYTEAVGRPGNATLRWYADTLELTHADSRDRLAYRRVP